MRREPKIHENVRIERAGAEGKCIAHVNEKVLFVEFAAPQDLVDVRVKEQKKSFASGIVERIIEEGPERVQPFCEHYGLCGGCKWQHLSYEGQLANKAQQVKDAFKRIGHLDFPEPAPIMGSVKTRHYRNKLEFAFSNKKWLEQIADKDVLKRSDQYALGYHLPGRYDKIFNVGTCYLQDDLHNEIRNNIRAFTADERWEYYDVYAYSGFLRNMFLRNNSKGQWMLIMVFGSDDAARRSELLDFVH